MVLDRSRGIHSCWLVGSFVCGPEKHSRRLLDSNVSRVDPRAQQCRQCCDCLKVLPQCDRRQRSFFHPHTWYALLFVMSVLLVGMKIPYPDRRGHCDSNGSKASKARKMAKKLTEKMKKGLKS